MSNKIEHIQNASSDAGDGILKRYSIVKERVGDTSAPSVQGKTGKKRGRPRKNPDDKSKKLRISFLGGLNEIGKNTTLYNYGDDMIIVDCGLAFPDQDMLGVDLVIPDFTYYEQNASKIKGIFITHGHEDHIGALPYLLKSVNIPIYATRLSAGLISAKLREHGLLADAQITVVSPGDKIKLGEFEVEFIHVNHSIPDAVAFAIRCGAGTIVQTGDFKIDSTPIDGAMIDLARLSQIGHEGVLCLLSDSTNAEREGYTVSERKVGESFETLFRRAENKRLVIATFASNVHRVQQIMDIAKKLGRKVALSGRSLENVVAIGQELGCLKIPDNLLVEIDSIKNYPPEQMVIITTGSQGEPMSALTRMAMSEHRKVSICPNDYVIISATPIPGNEKTVSKVVNELMKLGADVVYEKMYEVHVSGHACREEQKIMMGLTKPKFFIPVHGEQKHLRKHAQLAETMGIPRQNIIIADNGNTLEISKKGIRQAEPVPAGRVFVDGYGVGDVGNAVMRERRRLAEDGLLIISATVQRRTGYLISGPEVISRGFVYTPEAATLISDAENLAAVMIDELFTRHNADPNSAKAKIRDGVSRLMYERTKRSPMVLPIIMEID